MYRYMCVNECNGIVALKCYLSVILQLTVTMVMLLVIISIDRPCDIVAHRVRTILCTNTRLTCVLLASTD